MAIVEMSKLNIVAMSYERDKILNALQRTGATEVKLHSQTEYAVPLKEDCGNLKEYLADAENTLGELSLFVEKYSDKYKLHEKVEKDGFDITYSEFVAAKDKKEEEDRLISRIKELFDERKKCISETEKLLRAEKEARVYADVKTPLKIENTKNVRYRFGVVPHTAKEKFVAALQDMPLTAYDFTPSDGEEEIVTLAVHKVEAEKLDSLLQTYGFVKCQYEDGRTGEEVYADILSREKELEENLENLEKELFSLKDEIKNLKIYCDYVGFELEKAELSDKMLATQYTVLIEAYAPTECREKIAEELSSSSDSVYFEFTEPLPEDNPPTLLRNNKAVENFEAITNMYSVPHYREFDPNAVMSVFYSIFLGFIMADIGYGLLMILGGGFIWLKKRARGGMIASLGGVFAIGGIFSIIWGILFNSLFGFALLPFKVMPDLQGAAMSWSLSGINVPALLIISMLIGVVQLGAGYVCKAVQCFKRGQISDGIFDGLVWAIFSVGVCLAIAGFVEEFNVQILAMVGGIIAGVSLVIAMLTAGRKEKLVGKFTKGFGAAYGVINYASDILSYARLYGLMLAGAVIAEIISDNSVALITGGNIGLAVLGVAIMLIGHIFNLAIGLLGAYIHDARLQYVEFYGKFYEGEGELFSPLGSKHKHVYINY